MTATPVLSDWVRLCRAEGVDPAEVRLVMSRFRAYQGYYARGNRPPGLPLEGWFTWYHAEVASEHGPQAPPPSGCSVDDESRGRGAITKPEAFLKALLALDAVERTP